MDLEKRERKKLLLFIAGIFGIIVFFKYIFMLCWPLVIALGIVSLIYDRLWNVERRTGISRMLLTVILVLFGILFVAILAGGILYGISQMCVNQMGNMMELERKCLCCIEEICWGISKISGIRLDDVTRTVNAGLVQVGAKSREVFIPQILEKSVISFQFMISALTVLLITSILVIILMKEYGSWKEFFYQKEFFVPVFRILKRLRYLIKQYVKAEIIIMLVIMTIVAVGMYCADVMHPILWAILTAFLDMLPFIGTGLVLLPMGIWFVIEKKYLSAIILVVVYVVCVIAREYLEPKLIGRGMQISAAGILISIFAGIKIYGIIGVLFGPLTLMLVVEIYREIYQIDGKTNLL